jgi:hypothetical protein
MESCPNVTIQFHPPATCVAHRQARDEAIKSTQLYFIAPEKKMLAD